MALSISLMFVRNSWLPRNTAPVGQTFKVHAFRPVVTTVQKTRIHATSSTSLILPITLWNKIPLAQSQQGVRNADRLHKLYSSSATSEQGQQQPERSDNLSQSSKTNSTNTDGNSIEIPLYLAEGLLAVHKPLNWTSQDMVSYIRGMLERDARNRGAQVTPMRSRRNKARKVKVGHGGTLDPLATGVLVIGVGHGTKQLNDYLSGSKAYRATGKLGMETSTLDLDPSGTVVKEAPWEHVTREALEDVLPMFRGTIEQVPPLYSAKRVNGKKLYEVARSGNVDENLVIESKQVEIYSLDLVSVEELPHFTIDMECGGGTFVRSLIRDVAYELDSVATTIFLQRTKQGPFVLEDCLAKDDLTAETIYAQIDEWNTKLAQLKADAR